MKHEINRFLIIRTDRIGDVLLTLPMVQVIKRHFPQAYVAMLIRRYTSELVEDNGHVDKILFYDQNGGILTPISRLVREIRSQRFDVVIHTQPRPRLALITWLSGIPIRIGTGYRWYSFLFNKKHYEHRKDAKRHELEYNMNLLSVLGCTISGNDIQPSLTVKPEIISRVEKQLENRGINFKEKLIILHPGSGGSARDWSYHKFGDLGHRLGNIPGIRVVITGKKEEEELVNNVASVAGSKAAPLIGFGNLREFAALMKLSTLFVSNSTGPIHLAAAVGTPVIGLYPQVTSLSAARWGPYTADKTIFSPRNQPVDCKKCQIQKSNICDCMESISVDEVFQAVVQRLGLK